MSNDNNSAFKAGFIARQQKNEKFHSEQKSFNEWKHGSRTPLQLTSTLKVFFLAMNGVLCMNGRSSIVEVDYSRKLSLNSLEMRCDKWRDEDDATSKAGRIN